MSSLQRFKNWLLSRNLKKKLASQSPKDIPELNPSRKIGILFDATRESDRQAIKEYTRKLRDRGCVVTLLGFINKRLNHNLFDFLMYHKGLINWYGMPKSSDIDRFVDSDLDILFNLDPDDKRHMHIISAMSRAKFKVSMAHRNGIPYNLILDSKYKSEIRDVILELEIHLRKLSV